MKKALCLLFAAFLLLLCACGTGGAATTSAPATTSAAATTAAPATSAAPPPETTAAATTAAPAAQATSAASAAGEEHEPVTLRFYIRYSDPETIEPYDFMIERLKEAMPWVTIELDPMAADGNVKIKSYAATGDMPDIFGVGGRELADTLIKSGSIADMTDKLTELGVVDKVLPGSLDKLWHPEDHRIYTLPYSGSEVSLLYVNQGIFDENGIALPRTLDQLKDATAQFAAKGITPLSIFAKETWICFEFCNMIASRYIPSGFTALEDGTATIDDEGYRQAAQTVLDLSQAGMFPRGATNINYEQATSIWYENQSAMFVNGQWEIPTTTEKLGDRATWIPIPAVSEEKYEASQYDFTGGRGQISGLGVAANSKNLDTAIEVAAFIAEQFSYYDYNMLGSPTIAMDVEKDPSIAFSPMMQKIVDYTPKITSTAILGSVTDSTINATLQDECQRLIAGNTTADEFIANVSRVIK